MDSFAVGSQIAAQLTDIKNIPWTVHVFADIDGQETYPLLLLLYNAAAESSL